MHASKLRVVVALTGALALAGCEGSNGFGGMSREQTLGSAGGAVVGGLAGYAISGGAVGALIGAAAGGVIGNRLGNFLEGDAENAAALAAARSAEFWREGHLEEDGRNLPDHPRRMGRPHGCCLYRVGRENVPIHPAIGNPGGPDERGHGHTL